MAPLLLLALASAKPVAAPITQVTVFGDRARVVRTAHLGAGAVSFPVLPQTVDPESIRVTLVGAGLSLKQVQIGEVPPEAFPVGPGQALLAAIEALDDQILKVDVEAQATRAALDLLRSAVPAIAPTVDPGALARPRPLDPAGWPAAIGFAKATEAALRGRLRASSEQDRQLREQRQLASEKARLLAAQAQPSGRLVRATLQGAAGVAATATLTYEVRQASWRPQYDLQFDPAKGEVHLSLSALVSQQTGEDWPEAQLILSTAAPGAARTFPELPVWKIGERERFLPTPRPRPLWPSPPPPARPLAEATDAGAAVRERLLMLASQPPPPIALAEESSRTEADQGRQGLLEAMVAGKAAEVRSAAPSPEPFTKAKKEAFSDSPLQAAAEERDGEPSRPSAPPRARPPPESEVMRISMAPGSAAPPPALALPLGPPAHYRPPVVSPDSPAALAGGYLLSYPSLRPETVPSGSGSRRVALFSRTFPVAVSREVFPALADGAFLLAELRNPSADPLPAGPAELFVGEDPAGSARLPLAAPGEKVTLPLGLDRALHPIRRIELVQAEKGVFTKDDVRDYQVTIELANPYPRAIEVEVVDQVPLTHDAHVQIALGAVEPPARPDPLTGKLDWRLTLPGGAKEIVSFHYSVRCPKGFRLHQ